MDSVTTDLVAWLGAQLDHDEQFYSETAEVHDPERQQRLLRSPDGNESYIVDQALKALHVVAAHRAILGEVASWTHAYNDDDYWFSCGLAVAPGETEPGTGCGNDDHIGRCTCGLEGRRMRLLGPLAAIYAGREGYNPAWAVNG